MGLTPKPESELGLMALGGITIYLQEAMIDQVTAISASEIGFVILN